MIAATFSIIALLAISMYTLATALPRLQTESAVGRSTGNGTATAADGDDVEINEGIVLAFGVIGKMIV